MPLPDRVLIDTSAFYALLSATDTFHQRGRDTYDRLIDRDLELWTTSYVLVETLALAHRRLGFSALQQLVDVVEKRVSTFWIDGTVHGEAWNRLAANQGRGLSFVDWTTALVSRMLNAHIFTFDTAFAARGLAVVPR